jgi:hypothetical protein
VLIAIIAQMRGGVKGERAAEGVFLRNILSDDAGRG